MRCDVTSEACSGSLMLPVVDGRRGSIMSGLRHPDDHYRSAEGIMDAASDGRYRRRHKGPYHACGGNGEPGHISGSYDKTVIFRHGISSKQRFAVLNTSHPWQHGKYSEKASGWLRTLPRAGLLRSSVESCSQEEPDSSIVRCRPAISQPTDVSRRSCLRRRSCRYLVLKFGLTSLYNNLVTTIYSRLF